MEVTVVKIVMLTPTTLTIISIYKIIAIQIIENSNLIKIT